MVAGLLDPLRQFVVEKQLGFVEGHQAGALFEAVAVGGQLLLHHLQISHHIIGAGIHQVNQQPRALDMAQEVMAEAGPLGRTGNQPGDISKHGAIPGGTAHHAQVGHQGCEGVVGDLRSCR